MLVTRSFSELKNMKLPAGILIFAVVAVPWYWAMYSIHGNPFIETFLGFHNITRFTSPEHAEGVLWYYFIPVLILGFFPWTAILIQSVWTSLTASRRGDFSALVFLNIWMIFIFLFFSISRTKLVSYILPMFPPLAMIVGWYLARLWEYRRQQRMIIWPGVLTVFVILLIGGMVIGLKTMPELLYGVIATAGIFIVMLLGCMVFSLATGYQKGLLAANCRHGAVFYGIVDPTVSSGSA